MRGFNTDLVGVFMATPFAKLTTPLLPRGRVFDHALPSTVTIVTNPDRLDDDTGLYTPHGKAWIKEFLFKYFQQQAQR